LSVVALIEFYFKLIICITIPEEPESLELFLRLRNAVAHGGDLAPEERIDQQVYVRFKNLVIDLMYEIRLKMLYGLKHETFCKK
jgi:hypothetical protein